MFLVNIHDLFYLRDSKKRRMVNDVAILNVPPSAREFPSAPQNSGIYKTENRSALISILFGTEFHYRHDWWYLGMEPWQRQCGDCLCHFKYNREDTGKYDAILFEYSNQLVYSGKLNLSYTYTPHQYWILYNHEAHNNNYRLYNKLRSDVFNLSATYSRDADITLKYGECSHRTNSTFKSGDINFAANKTGLVVWHVSKCKTLSNRLEYVNNLRKFIPVDTNGLCGSNRTREFTQGNITFGKPVTNEALKNINNYKFYLSFENTYCKDYITEKVYKILRDDVRVVPVVRGAGPYKDFLPAGSYIDAANFRNAKSLAKFLHVLDKNDTMYNEYFKPREKFKCDNLFGNTHSWPCAICKKIWELKKSGRRETLSQKDIDDVFLPSYTCKLPETMNSIMSHVKHRSF